MERDNLDLSDIATRAGFKNRRDLTDYMKSQGWLWCTEQDTYIREGLASQEVAMDTNDEQPEESNVLEHEEIWILAWDDFYPY